MLKRTIKNTLLAVGMSIGVGTASGLAATLLMVGIHKVVKKIRNK